METDVASAITSSSPVSCICKYTAQPVDQQSARLSTSVYMSADTCWNWSLGHYNIRPCSVQLGDNTLGLGTQTSDCPTSLLHRLSLVKPSNQSRKCASKGCTAREQRLHSKQRGLSATSMLTSVSVPTLSCNSCTACCRAGGGNISPFTSWMLHGRTSLHPSTDCTPAQQHMSDPKKHVHRACSLAAYAIRGGCNTRDTFTWWNCFNYKCSPQQKPRRSSSFTANWL